MAKSMIYTVNNTLADITDGSVIPLGTIIRRFGQQVKQDGNSIIVCDKPGCPGYYNVDIVATLEVAAAADYKVVLEKDGTPVIGGVAEINPTPAGAILPFPIHIPVRNGCGGTSNLSIRLVGGDAKAINVTTMVTRM